MIECYAWFMLEVKCVGSKVGYRNVNKDFFIVLVFDRLYKILKILKARFKMGFKFQMFIP